MHTHAHHTPQHALKNIKENFQQVSAGVTTIFGRRRKCLKTSRSGRCQHKNLPSELVGANRWSQAFDENFFFCFGWLPWMIDYQTSGLVESSEWTLIGVLTSIVP